MRRIEQITSAALQKQRLVLPDGTAFDLTIYFRPMQYGWFIEELTYGDFVLRGVRITNLPNILHQWKNKLPFGLACFSKQNREPSQPLDFQSGDSSLYILSESEVDYFTEYRNGQV